MIEFHPKQKRPNLKNPSELSQDLKSVEAGVLHNWKGTFSAAERYRDGEIQL